MLENINSSKDIKKLHIDELEKLADEIRSEIVKTTLHNGGHLASNLGAVEITLALHYVFDFPEDKLVFDVGHQCYTHKLITGRRESFAHLRQKDGISGFPSHSESEYDTFDAGHASSAVSSALGLAKARDVLGEDYNVVAVVGDGAIGGGMAFEALNDAGDSPNTKLIIVLNDNEMSISENVGALSGHFSKLRATKGYVRSKENVSRALKKINRSGRLFGALVHLRNTLRYFLIGETIFDSMNIKYLGPINGHSLKDMIEILHKAKDMNGPVIIHALTCKGCGYGKAEENPEKYHGVSNSSDGKIGYKKYSEQFSDTLTSMAEKDGRVCAVTAGMTYNTGLLDFAKKYPEKFFDTGIAEQHALAMAGGLAKGGLRPYTVIYSTFLQRGFDQIFHDICLQRLPVTVCIDHAGLTGDDGATHQGTYDLGFLRSMPHLTVLAPRDTDEFDRMLKFALSCEDPVALRYPKGSAYTYEWGTNFENLCWDELVKRENGTVITFGAMIEEGAKVAENLGFSLIDARTLKPLDECVLRKISSKPICVIEDNAPEGGLCEGILSFYARENIRADVYGFALKDEFVSVGTASQQRRENGLDSENITEKMKNEIG